MAFIMSVYLRVCLVITIIWPMLSVYLCPKVITLSGFHCINKTCLQNRVQSSISNGKLFVYTVKSYNLQFTNYKLQVTNYKYSGCRLMESWKNWLREWNVSWMKSPKLLFNTLFLSWSQFAYYYQLVIGILEWSH